jgi:hypothetical protein
MIYRLLADSILIGHAVFIVFVICGLVAIVFGAGFQWQWVRSLVFRIAHLLAIGIVVLQTWLGVVCPLTAWEMLFRQKGGEATYRESFLAHWQHTLFFFEAPDWVFTLCYTVFGSAVLAAWFLVRPRMPWNRRADKT